MLSGRDHGLAFACICALGTGAAMAQTGGAEDDPLLAGWDEEESAIATTHGLFGDVALRGDRVTGFSARDDVERLRGRLRIGWRGAGDNWEYALAAKVNLASGSNVDNRRNNDNERSDAVGLDQAFVRWLPSENTALTVGKSSMPLSLTPLVWDADLRPLGFSVNHLWSLRGADGLRLTAGYFAGDHLYGDDSRIAAAQLAWTYNEGAPFSADVQLAYLDFSDLRQATAQGLTRTNLRFGNQLASDYRLLDLQFGGRWQVGEKAVVARLDLLRNLGADDERNGARGSVVYGDADSLPGWELGFAYERIQRDAAQAAFNEDDWWFHSFARGAMPWVGYGLHNGWSLRSTLFVERRDASSETLRRLLLEVRRAF
ncbi:MAG: putative porin [Pseudomarimonas sp.]